MYGQEKSKADFIADFTKERFIVWPEDSKGKGNFIIAIVNDSALFNELLPLYKKKPLFRKRKISLNYYPDFKQASTIKSGIIYLHAKEGVSMGTAIQAVSGKSILVVGENYPYHQSMINFISQDGKISFEYNEDLIKNQGLTITEELSRLSSKNEIQWNKLLAETAAKLKKEQELIAQQNKEIRNTKNALNSANQNLSEKELELVEKSETLDSTNQQLSLRDRELAIKHKESEMQAEKIASQNRFITIMIVAIILGLIAIFFIYRSYTISKRTNAKLTELNKALKLHKDEIYLQKTIVEEKKKEITDSIYYAQRIQRSLLHSQKGLNNYLQHSFILFKPKDIVSGDFYWFNQVNQHKILFSVVDCTGHGVPGALMSVIGINQLNKIVNENKVVQPNIILQELDFATRATLHHENNEDSANDGMEMAMCLLDKENLTLTYSGAFNPLWVVTKNAQDAGLQQYLNNRHIPEGAATLIELPADKKSIAGMYKLNHQFSAHSIKLQKGDCIYLFSDGYADQFGGKEGKKFKKQQLKDTLINLHDQPMDKQLTTLESLFEKWKGSFEQIDDVCVMGIKL